MNRKRVWEIVAGVVLLLVVVGVAGGILYHKRLNDQLLAAIKPGNSTVVASLLQRGAHVNAVDKTGRTPLMLAALWRDTKLVRLLLSAGADLEAKDREGKTALSLAEGKAAQYESLMARGRAEVMAAVQRIEATLDRKQPGVREQIRQNRLQLSQVKSPPNPFLPMVRLLKQHGATK